MSGVKSKRQAEGFVALVWCLEKYSVLPLLARGISYHCEWQRSNTSIYILCVDSSQIRGLI